MPHLPLHEEAGGGGGGEGGGGGQEEAAHLLPCPRGLGIPSFQLVIVQTELLNMICC